MENILLTLIVVLLVMLLFAIGGAAVVGWKLLQKRPAHQAPALPSRPEAEVAHDKLHPEIRRRMEEARKLKELAHPEATCRIHTREPSEGACAICDQYFCKSCLKPQQSLLFCKEHVALYLGANWVEIHSVKSSPQDPEAGVDLVEWKKTLWEKETKPSYIQTHYKINLEGDQIESWVVLYVREQEREEMKKRVSSSFRHSPAIDQ
jgi:hypothetical protein